ncbi:protein of unknown function [Paraburkholderia dioscoreae]|uniref:Uncharacterized protein n=1 Tax=Paraburkholderia dioscoreae TaxID=2604047 RepID=A0A5Q4ZAN9_9BURK|nr:protein of unknown function [Paraburkholderia dioscoreae]
MTCRNGTRIAVSLNALQNTCLICRPFPVEGKGTFPAPQRVGKRGGTMFGGLWGSSISHHVARKALWRRFSAVGRNLSTGLSTISVDKCVPRRMGLTGPCSAAGDHRDVPNDGTGLSGKVYGGAKGMAWHEPSGRLRSPFFVVRNLRRNAILLARKRRLPIP